MNLTDWIVSLSGAAIAIILGIAGYFIQKWIHAVDETLKEHTNDFKTISEQISSLKSRQAAQTENIVKLVKDYLTTNKPFSIERLDEIQKEVCFLKSILQDKLLPQISRHGDSLGRVILIEKNLREQDLKMTKLFEVLRAFVLQKQKNPK